MSAIPKPIPAPGPAGVPRALPPLPARRRPWLWVCALLAVVIAGALVWRWAAPPGSRPVAYAGGMRTVKLTAGSFDRVLRVSGTTAAGNFASITAPRMLGPDSGRDLVILKLAKSGAYVHKGDTVAELDAQALKDHISDIDAQVKQAEGDIKKRRAEQAIEMENLQQSLRVAKANLEKAQFDFHAAPIRTDIDREILNLNVEEAQASYKEIQEDLETTKEKQRLEISILDYTRQLQTRHRDRHKHDLQKFTIASPMSGLAVMETIWRGGDMGQVQEGDQISPGEPFMKVVDPNSMQMQAVVNQSESENLHIGQTAEVRLDAFPELRFPGKVHSIGAMGTMGWRENYYIRTIPVRITIARQDSRLIPDLSASADVVLGQIDKALRAPLDAIHFGAGQQFVIVKNGADFHEQPVELGPRNNTHAVVLKGVSAGAEVVLGAGPLPASQ